MKELCNLFKSIFLMVAQQCGEVDQKMIFTIPSFYEEMSNNNYINFGYNDYTSSQELNMLLKYINLVENLSIYFFMMALTIFSINVGKKIDYSHRHQKKLKKYEYKYFKNWYHFETLDLIKNNKDYIINFINYFANEADEFFDCHKNKKKSKLIVKKI